MLELKGPSCLSSVEIRVLSHEPLGLVAGLRESPGCVICPTRRAVERAAHLVTHFDGAPAARIFGWWRWPCMLSRTGLALQLRALLVHWVRHVECELLSHTIIAFRLLACTYIVAQQCGWYLLGLKGHCMHHVGRVV